MLYHWWVHRNLADEGGRSLREHHMPPDMTRLQTYVQVEGRKELLIQAMGKVPAWPGRLANFASETNLNHSIGIHCGMLHPLLRSFGLCVA